MGYYDTPEPEAAPRVISCASPKTHVPGSRVKERGHRYYSANLSRWINRDPVGEKGGLNLYGFVGNNSVNGKDSIGLSLTCPPDSPNCPGNAPPCHIVPPPSTCTKADADAGSIGEGPIYIQPCTYNDGCLEKEGTQTCRKHKKCVAVTYCGPADPGGEKPSTGYYWMPDTTRCGPCTP